MGVSVVTYGGRTLVDMTDATITPEKVLKGYVGYGADGDPVVGTLEVPKYIELEYIETSGTQCIDTGFNPNQDTKLEIVYQTSDTSEATVAGCDEDWCVNAFCMFVNIAEYGTKSSSVTLYGSSQITATLDGRYLDKNGSTAATFTSQTFQCPCSITLFACNRNGDLQEFATGKIYSCQVYDDGTLVRDFIPCIDIASGEVGMWELVDDKFYSNAGTGTFGCAIAAE